MARYLTCVLHAPLASFGALAIGERRSGWDRPGRSAVLGVVGACLGIDRADAAAQTALGEGYGLAVLCYSAGRLLVDYHTTQMPSTERGVTYATRAEELRAADLNTVLSRRDYRTGAWHVAALWEWPDARWSLDEIAAAMKAPVFVPYLGRKSCPLGLPLAPLLVEAVDAPEALVERNTTGPEARPGTWWGRYSPTLRDGLADRPGEPVVAMDAPDGCSLGDPGYIAPTDPRRRRTERRRDQCRSRVRWQFDLRDELVLGVTS